MRKVTYWINDLEYFKKQFKEDGVEDPESILSNTKPFVCKFILQGRSNSSYPDHSFIYDMCGNNIPRGTLNGYERGVILNACYSHFSGGCEDPTGVIKIEEEVV